MTDVIVVGLGAVGSATLYQLALAGVRAIGIDRFHPPHDRGSSHGETRITRQAIGEGAQYSPYALRSHAIWRTLEAETGERLLLECGFLGVDTSGGLSVLHGKPGFLDTTIAAAEQHGIAHERLSPAEARRRFPQFAIPDEAQVYHEPGGGLVFPEACIRAQLGRAVALGAELHVDEQVLTLEEDAGGVRVVTTRGAYQAARAVVTAGGWTLGLIGERLSHLRLLRQVLHWFAPEDPARWDAARTPTYIWTHGAGPDDSFYGFPMVQGLTPGVKVATEQYADATPQPELIDRQVAPAEVTTMWRDHVAGRLTGVTATALKGTVCFYTMAPHGDFLIDDQPDAGRIMTVSACSGHGFKHSAGLGEAIAARIEAAS
ncbi:N-methyl-L-tryptophan oxidase [uncultured Sphingomonas sp.]|uniref:N-methyl-L-tryptophan oxidase n=1 Tax=uncultured Sphingomonas sp. TaxID=158754 RepID=UPI0035CBC713